MYYGTLIKLIADLLVKHTPLSMRPTFFRDLANELLLRGYDIEANQGGIRGTQLLLVKKDIA